MNMSDIITTIKIDLGLYSIALPFDNPESAIEDVIKLKTLKTFSIFQPYYERIYINLDQLEKLYQTNNSTTYLLPDVFGSREILFIREVSYDETNLTGMSYYGGLPIGGNLMQQAMLANAGAKLAGAMIPKMTFEFKHPRELTLFNITNSYRIVIDAAFSHDKTLASIPDTCYDSFIELAELDVKSFLYNTLKHYDELPSAYATISLKIDDWANAESDRKQLIDEWRNTYHLDVMPFEYA